MGEVRLVPAALVVWATSACVILFPPLVGVCVVVLAALACLLVRQVGQAVLVVGMGAGAAAATWLRVHSAAAWDPAGLVVGTVVGAARETASGAYLVRVRVPGTPSPTPVFTDTLPEGVAAGAQVIARGVDGASRVAGVNPHTLRGSLEVVGEPEGLHAFALHVRETFRAAVESHVGEQARGLIPGMVLGDTSLQSSAEQDAYIATGLSHLSAVSGSNVAIVTSFAVLAAAAARLGLRGRTVAAAGALLLYAALVGPDPSVLRASVTGLVGLTAVLASRQSEPIHALCLAVIGLVLVDSNLAVHFGFILSVAATAGIVALFPLLYKALAVTQWPDILVRALAVAVAADIATMPVVALMAGRVSLVSVAANVLVAPLTAPITVLGLAAAALSLMPGGLETPLLFVVEPMARWVRAVAEVGANLPHATVEAGALTALVSYGWIVAGLVASRPRITVGVAAAVLVVATAPWHTAPRVDPASLRAHVVQSTDEVEPVPADAQLVVVLEEGKPHSRPVVTRGGIPVIFPNRDGFAVLRTDGTQMLRSGGAHHVGAGP